MGPIMQERSASTTMKRVEARDNTCAGTSSKQGNRMRRAVENGLPGQDKDTLTAAHRAHSKRSRFKAGADGNKLSSPVDEAGLRPRLRPHRKDETGEKTTLCGAKNRRALSLPISPISGLRHMQPLVPPQVPPPEAFRRHYTQKEDDTDSASDLSDSERLPVLPSPCTPCTPPHLNLRAEVINTNDFPADIPGPPGAVGAEEGSEEPVYSYPDFLPPPFNSWSLRQLAVFLHTDGRGAPRPKPVGPLEKYLERLLKLEWLQIQTINAENSRPPGSRPRPQTFPSSSPPQRPHTAPSSRLNSPKGFRQSQRSSPFAPVITPPAPAAHQPLPRLPACPHCHNRFPICSGSCSSYAYQRHSRLSPLLERRARPGGPVKRSSSETREGSKEVKSPGGQTPVSPSAAKSHIRHMQASGNARKPTPEPASDLRGPVRRTRVRASSETDVKKDAAGVKVTAAADKRVSVKKEASASKKDWPRTEAGGQRSCVRRVTKEQQPLASRASLSTKLNGKTKNVQFVAK